jgi:flagellar basal-body rod protein FlgG
MNGAFEIGAVALRADQQALEIIANNIANVNSPAFKRSDPRFSEVLARQVQIDGSSPMTGGQPVPEGAGVRIAPMPMLFSQGTIRTTGNPMDLAIDGQGLIELMGPAGQDLLWRGGSLRVNEDGLLATADGIPLRAGVVMPLDAQSFSISPAGIVSALSADNETVELGQIHLVRAEHENALERLDNGLLRPLDNICLIDALPGEDGVGLFRQGSLEGSNVELSEEMVQMLIIQRAFAANAQAIQAADQIAAITNNLKK